MWRWKDGGEQTVAKACRAVEGDDGPTDLKKTKGQAR